MRAGCLPDYGLFYMNLIQTEPEIESAEAWQVREVSDKHTISKYLFLCRSTGRVPQVYVVILRVVEQTCGVVNSDRLRRYLEKLGIARVDIRMDFPTKLLFS